MEDEKMDPVQSTEFSCRCMKQIGSRFSLFYCDWELQILHINKFLDNSNNKLNSLGKNVLYQVQFYNMLAVTAKLNICIYLSLKHNNVLGKILIGIE